MRALMNHNERNFLDNRKTEANSGAVPGCVPRLTKETTFRSTPMVNMTDDMVKVELIMSRNDWQRVKKALKDLGT